MNETHTLTVGTKRQAGALSMITLFKPINGKTATTRYDRGKYARNLHGETLEVPMDVAALWTERRKDKDGPYWALFCYTTKWPRP